MAIYSDLQTPGSQIQLSSSLPAGKAIIFVQRHQWRG